MIHTPFDTAVCRHYSLTEICKALALAEAHGELQRVDEQTSGVLMVTSLKTNQVRVPQFSHPLYYVNARKEVRLAIDARSLVSPRDSIDQPLRVKSPMELALLTHRAILQRAWSDGRGSELRNISSLPQAVFARWVSETIARQTELTPDVQLKLSILTAFYFSCLFMDDEETLSEQRVLKIATSVAKSTYAPLQNVLDVLEGVPVLRNLGDYCDEVRAKGWSDRLAKLEPGLVLAFLAGSWNGVQAQELVGVALEHPPTFYSLLFAAINERGFKRTRLADLMLRWGGRSGEVDLYTQNYRRFLDAWRT